MKRIIIVGGGALGSHLILLLRNEEINITVIDFDKIERKNILSQFHSITSVGKNKAVALQQTMKFLFNIKIEAVPHKITKENVDVLLKNANLVIDCLDNFEARSLVQNFVRKAKIPCLHGALAANGELGRIVWDEHFIIDSEFQAGAATCEDGEHLAFITIVAANLAYAAHVYLNNNKKINRQIFSGGLLNT